MIALLAAMLIPPPPDWTPPRMTGPGLLCGSSFGLDLRPGETGTWEWPGEIFMNDVFGTVHVATPRGEVLINENGDRTRPQGGMASRRTRRQPFHSRPWRRRLQRRGLEWLRPRSDPSLSRDLLPRRPAGRAGAPAHRRAAEPAMPSTRKQTTDEQMNMNRFHPIEHCPSRTWARYGAGRQA